MMRMTLCWLTVMCLVGTSATAGPLGQPSHAGAIAGVVRDASGAVLPGAVVTVRTDTGRVVAVVAANGAGEYRVSLEAGLYGVEIALPHFGTRRHTAVRVADDETRTFDTTLALTLTADVTVTGKRSFRNLSEIDSADAGLLGIADTASEGLVTARQLDARPIMRTGEILEAVPGLVISQHSGEGKANQYSLRGFNLDHGTDFATTVAGVPVNLPTHAHGQGYSDVNFLLPELVGAVQFLKGLYSAEQGDFSTAGAAHVRYVNQLERPLARVSVGGDGWRRFVGAASPRVASGHLLVALERAHNDGPWVRPDDYRKTNAVVRFSRGDVQNGFSLTAMSYRGTWNSTDQLPARAVETRTLTRFGGVDATTGGDTARHSVSGEWQKSSGSHVTRANGYVVRNRLNLFSNVTYFLDDPDNGDQFEQADRRWIGGGRATHRRLGTWGGHPIETVVGLDLRRDAIGEVGLHRTVTRRRLSTVREDAVQETAMGVFAQHDVQWNPWLRTTVGLRGDRYWFDVDAGSPLNGGTAGAELLSPKGGVVFGPFRRAEIYLSAGTGFHSNDARGTTMTVDPVSGEPVDTVTPLTRARGAEVGLRAVPWQGLQATVAAWTLALDSELVFVGDAGTTAAGRPSRRSGVELTLLYSPRPWLAIDGDLAFSRARFTDPDPAGTRIPGALGRVAAAGVTVHENGRLGGSLRLRHFGPRELVEDGRVRSRSTSMLNAQLVFRASAHVGLVLDAFNLLDARDSDIDYFYTSRLPGEPASGIGDVHSHPALPRALRVGVQIGF